MPLRYMGRVQMWLLPPTPDQLLPLNRPARPVAEFVDAPVRERRRELALENDCSPPSSEPAAHRCPDGLEQPVQGGGAGRQQPLANLRVQTQVAEALLGPHQVGQCRPQPLAADPVSSFPNHDQRLTYRLDGGRVRQSLLARPCIRQPSRRNRSAYRGAHIQLCCRAAAWTQCCR